MVICVEVVYTVFNLAIIFFFSHNHIVFHHYIYSYGHKKMQL